MLGRLRQRLTFANTISLIALFVALGGSSYAALKLPKNSVGGGQIKKNAVISSDVKDRALLAKDFKRGQLPRGAAGPAGAAGPKGDSGAGGGTGGGGSMAARVRSAGPQASAEDGLEVAWPVTGGTWTQGAEEANVLAGEVDVTAPSSCTGMSYGTISVRLGSELVLVFSTAAVDVPPTTTKRVRLYGDTRLASRGAPTPRELSVVVSDSCDGAGQNYTFNNLRVDVGVFR